MGKKLPDYYDTGNYGDGREQYALQHVLQIAPAGDPDATLEALEVFHQRWSLLHIGPGKGARLDQAVLELVSRRAVGSDDANSAGLSSERVARRNEVPTFVSEAVSARPPLRLLDVGTYIGYSAIRMARLLPPGKDHKVITLEQNTDNARVAQYLVEHAGLADCISVQNCALVEYLDEQRLHEQSDMDAVSRFGFDLVFLDHRKSEYLTDFKRLDAVGALQLGTIVVADNVASREHTENRAAAIARGARKKPCKCVNRGCNFLFHLQHSGRFTDCEVVMGEKDGICVGRYCGDSWKAIATSTGSDAGISSASIVGSLPGNSSSNETAQSNADPQVDDALHVQRPDVSARTAQLSLPIPISSSLPINSIHHLSLRLQKLSRLPNPGILPACLRSLDISRNRFKVMPEALLQLNKLHEIDATRNVLAPTAKALLLDGLKSMPALQLVDVRFNARCGSVDLQRLLKGKGFAVSSGSDGIGAEPCPSNKRGQLEAAEHSEGPASPGPHDHSSAPDFSAVTIRLTLWGQFVGLAPSQRDATQLRAQLEPWPTSALRRRLCSDFGQDPDSLVDVERGEVVRRLLSCYRQEGLVDDSGRSRRREIFVEGQHAVDESTIAQLLEQMKLWVRSQQQRGFSDGVVVGDLSSQNRERPSISAEQYMILRSPAEFRTKGADCGQALRAAKKLAKHQKLWDLAETALRNADPEFADRFTALAVTFNFKGSPHIDRQNVGPFYGLSFGDWESGKDGQDEGGRLCVESSPREVTAVKTRNRFGKVDGRYPHWVSEYGGGDRYSLIFYQTEAGSHQPLGPAFLAEDMGD